MILAWSCNVANVAELVPILLVYASIVPENILLFFYHTTVVIPPHYLNDNYSHSDTYGTFCAIAIIIP